MSSAWYGSDKERYDYLYSDAELGEWVGALGDAPPGTEHALFLFNNCHRGQAAVNARRMQQLFADRAPFVDVVPPPASPVPTQATLFE